MYTLLSRCRYRADVYRGRRSRARLVAQTLRQWNVGGILVKTTLVQRCWDRAIDVVIAGPTAAGAQHACEGQRQQVRSIRTPYPKCEFRGILCNTLESMFSYCISTFCSLS